MGPVDLVLRAIVGVAMSLGVAHHPSTATSPVAVVAPVSVDPSNWASVPYGNRNAFRDFVGTHYLWHRALADQIFIVTGSTVVLLPIGDGGGSEWLLAVQRQYESECAALGLAAPPDLSSYDLSDPNDFASWTFLLSQQATILRTASGLP